ncbi:DNA-binding protein [Corynebacterium phocae]|uniref:DNA-binding protein n=1 Tax=Corynebacterium phocae TaxID=161895 RepID=A0A1L7D1L4_9CORY|nr:Fic family protein [Corynebacterium phocae]APT92035.1 DNA-binding protein [Corynebacterium phocae]KAA8726417.1 Fic family protein [Corynebacterium phocae]
MSRYESRNWVPADGSGLSRRDKEGGEYHVFFPDKILSDDFRDIGITPEVARKAAQVERSVARLSKESNSASFEGIARLLLRSEAISSSKIEGIAPNVDKVVLAELAQTEDVRGFKDNAESVARNLQVLDGIERLFATEDEITPSLLEDFQRQLLGENTNIPLGYRKIQNWIGGSDRNPIGADFVPPPPGAVGELMEDLCAYLDGAWHGVLIQAAIVHAQFETTHPFADGNGRVGRALIHGVIQRRNLTAGMVLPISVVLGTQSRSYIAGLEAFRAGNLTAWLEVFLDAAAQAVAQAEAISEDLKSVTGKWAERMEEYRKAEGRSKALRSDSVAARLLLGLAAHPIVTVAAVQKLYGVSPARAREALEKLTAAGIVREKIVGKGPIKGYYADDVLDLISHADRQLASSQFDTRLAPPPGRAAPALKQE